MALDHGSWDNIGMTTRHYRRNKTYKGSMYQIGDHVKLSIAAEGFPQGSSGIVAKFRMSSPARLTVNIAGTEVVRHPSCFTYIAPP
jgi:hypothetical protein